MLGFSRPSRCRARIGSASSAPSRPLTGFLAALATTRSERALDHCPPVLRDTGRARTVGIARWSRHAADPGAICAARSTLVWRAPPRLERRLAIVARVAAGAIPARRLRPGHQRSSRSEAVPARPVTARHEAPQVGGTVSHEGHPFAIGRADRAFEHPRACGGRISERIALHTVNGVAAVQRPAEAGQDPSRP